MKYQEVSVDYWKVLKSMLMYAFISLVGWIMLRLVSAIILLPRRLRAQQNQIQHSLQEFQKRFPDLKFTEEDLKEAHSILGDDITEDVSPKTEEIPAAPAAIDKKTM